MKNKNFSFAIAIAFFIMSGCAQTPDSVKSNKHKSGEAPSENAYSAVKNIYDSFEEAYETQYTKFTLPDKSVVMADAPEEIYQLELSPINAEKDTEWMEEKVVETAQVFGIEQEYEIENSGECNFRLVSSDRKAGIRLFSRAVFDITNEPLPTVDNYKALYVNRNNTEIDTNIKMNIDEAVGFSNEIAALLGDELINSASEVYYFTDGEKKQIEIDIQKFYKGVGIQNIYSQQSTEEMTKAENSLLADTFYNKTLFTEDKGMFLFHSCDAYKMASANKIDSILTFKGACDMLESQLADNINLELDDVKLWYEPVGDRQLMKDGVSEYDSFDGSKTVKCTPKWYFISYTEDSQYTANYVTVDCVTGEVEVFLP